MNTDKKRQWLSILITLVFHILIFFIPVHQSIETVPDQKTVSVPVNFVINDIKIPVPKPVSKKKRFKKKKDQPVQPLKADAKPVYPDDRKTPIVTKSGQPSYPKSAINNGWAGTVSVSVKISETGTILDIEVMKSSGHAVLDNAFMSVVKSQYYFKPKRLMGKNKVGRLKLSYNFEL